MKILITGASGMLGAELCGVLAADHEVIGLGRKSLESKSFRYISCDLTDTQGTQKLLRAERPKLIFHAAALTQVDLCETSRDLAMLHNVSVTQNLAELANEIDSGLIFFSTDYVFNGKSSNPYKESDPVDPVNFYGETKLLAENYIQSNCGNYLIIRISWLFGLARLSFPEFVLSQAAKQPVLNIVSDQWGRLSYAKDVALAMKMLIPKVGTPEVSSKFNQLYHLANQHMTSWYECARFILSQAKLNACRLNPITERDLKRPAKRPQTSVLSTDKINRNFGIVLRSWEDAIAEYIHDYQNSKGVTFP